MALKKVKLGRQRKCPYCMSNKWKWIKTLPISVENIGKYLTMQYECLKCGNEFIAKEYGKAKFVSSVKKCYNCGSQNIVLISKPDADIELHFCRQCHCYLAIKE